MSACQDGASGSNRAADELEAREVGGDQPLAQGCLGTMGGRKQWRGSISSRYRKSPRRSGGELTGKGKTGAKRFREEIKWTPQLESQEVSHLLRPLWPDPG